MSRVNSLALLLLAAYPIAVWGAEPPAEQSPKAAEATSTTGCCGGPHDGHRQVFPCYCLQQIWQDYPGPYDLYVCLTHLDNCNDGEEELWYGMPKKSRPQACYPEENQCELESAHDYRTKGIPGHDAALSAESAERMLVAALEAARLKTPKLEWEDPEFHVIPRLHVPEGAEIAGDVYVIAVQITGKHPAGKTLTLCIQTDPIADGQLTAATFQDAKLGSGRQLSIKYTVNGEERKGLVWLRERTADR